MHSQQGMLQWYPFYGLDNNRALESLSSSFAFKSFSILTYFTPKKANYFTFRKLHCRLSFGEESGSINRIVVLAFEEQLI